MDELLSVMQEVLLELREINGHLNDLIGSGINSMDDVCDKLDDIAGEISSMDNSLSELKGSGINSIDDICSKLDDTVEEINNIKGSAGYDLTDIHDVLSNIDVNTTGL